EVAPLPRADHHARPDLSRRPAAEPLGVEPQGVEPLGAEIPAAEIPAAEIQAAVQILPLQVPVPMPILTKQPNPRARLPRWSACGCAQTASLSISLSYGPPRISRQARNLPLRFRRFGQPKAKPCSRNTIQYRSCREFKYDSGPV